jgi:UDP-N-acetylmuramate--alanine ligase
MNLSETKSIHFVGIGGIGMSGLAEILAVSGVSVSGCDLRSSAATDLLVSRGVSVSFGHDPSHVAGNDMIVVTSAVKGENAEIDAARMQGVRIVKRSELLGAIVNEKRAVGVAGTHGKTTTSAMVSVILEELGLDPTVLVGGMIRNLGTNAKRGAGDILVVEADEYDRTFHQLHPEVAVVTNMEADHLEYYGSFEAIAEAFRIYLDGIKPGGVVIGCADDPNVRVVLDRVQGKVIRYGLSEHATMRAVNVEFSETGTSFEVPGVGFFKLFVPGDHNVQNALAAIAVALHFGAEPGAIAAALAKFLGVDRRFQVLGDYLGAIVVDDYAHHPTEIRATLEAARKRYPDRRIVALFQPHLFSRTRDFAREFGEALRVADVSLVSPVYAAREKPIEGVSARLISDAVRGVEFLDRSNSQIVNEVRRRLRPTDVFIAMGAGDVHEIAEQLVRGEEG